MSTSVLRTSLYVGWFTAVGTVVVWSLAADAKLSTSVLFLAMGLAPLVVMLLIGAGAPPPTVAELLHAVHTNDGR